MRKDKTLQNSTILDGMFPQTFPHAKNSGETNHGKISEVPQQGQGIEPQQPTLDEIWEWFSKSDEE